MRSGLAAAPEETLREIRALVADDPPGVGAESWYEILAAVFGYGDQELAREVFAVFDRRVGDDSPLRLERDSLRALGRRRRRLAHRSAAPRAGAAPSRSWTTAIRA